MQIPSAIAACLTLLLLPCAAQDAAKIRVRFLSFPASLEPVKIELRISEVKSVEIIAPSNEFSQPLEVESTGVWSVGETVANPEGKAIFVEYGRTMAPASPQQMLLLIRKGAKNSDGFDLIALDERKDGFGFGEFLFLNIATVDIAGTVGEEKFVVKPNKHMILKPKTNGEKQTAHAIFYFRKDDEARPFFSSRWPVNARARSMIFFYHDPETRNLRMHTVRDFL